MSGVTLRSEAAAQAPAPAPVRKHSIHGRAEIAFEGAGRDARLAHLYHSDPMRVLFPARAPGEMPSAVLVTTSGGLVGGDRLTVVARAGPAAAAQVAAQAAEKIYRSTGADVQIDVSLSAAPGSWLEWLPQETILFDGARLRRATTIDVAADARLTAGEIVVFGRIASGERMARGLLHESWCVRRDGRAVWADALHLDGAIASSLDAPAGFAGAVAAATVVHAGPGIGGVLEDVRGHLALMDTAGRVAATVVNGVLVVRFLAEDPLALRTGFGRFWAWFRNRVGGHPPRLPRLWSI